MHLCLSKLHEPVAPLSRGLQLHPGNITSESRIWRHGQSATYLVAWGASSHMAIDILRQPPYMLSTAEKPNPRQSNQLGGIANA